MLTKTQRFLIIATSIAIPVVVTLLFFVKLKGYEETFSFLPPFYATLNGLTAITLIWGVMSIRKGNRIRHQRLMKTSIFLSLIFLVCYVVYHMTNPTTKFGDLDHNGILSDTEKFEAGVLRYFYFILLISHILLSVAIIPLVLITYVKAISAQFDQHKKIARFTYPIWLYVAITGVVVYLLIAPYYAH